MAGASKTSRLLAALAVGAAATGIVLLCHLLGVDRRAELMALDFRFRHFSSAPASDGLLVVAIDDGSLEKLGRWPWPRQLTAGIAGVLHECGAQAVALDILFQEPQPTRYVSAVSDIYDPDAASLLGTAPPQPVFDDAALEEALAAQRVVLPMLVAFGPPERGGGLDRAVGEILAALPEIGFDELRSKLPPTPELSSAAREEDALKAYWRQRAMRALRRLAIPADRLASDRIHQGQLAPPLVRFARRCDRGGFVSFPRELDGVMRRIPLLARCGGEVYPQFAVALVSERLAGSGRGGALAARGGNVLIRLPASRQRAVPMDRRGRLLINWAPREGSFRQVPAAAVGYVWLQRQLLDKNRRVGRLLTLELARRLKIRTLIAAVGRADELYRRRVAWQIARQRAVLYDPNHVPAPPAGLAEAERKTEQRIDAEAADLYENLESFYLSAMPSGDPNRLVMERLARTHAALAESDGAIRRDIDENLAALREQVGGRLCLIGSTATGAADFVPTPVDSRMPGVLVHANIFNTIDSGAFVHEAPLAANLAAIVLAGLAVALLTAALPILRAAAAAVLLAGGYVALTFLLFGQWSTWLAVVGPVGAMALAFLMVTAYRELTEEREARHIRGLFSHALSPALVDRLIEDPSLARLGGEKRVLSSFISDLGGFTSLSERLGEQDTVRLLNRYFDRMTEVIQGRCGGYLNKFLGDGIIAFYGAPVVQDDHARRAIAAAVGCQQEVALLNRSLVEEHGDWVRLSCRVGVATGPVMVGNCGSSQRMDYTAIGDCVNLSSRLESANKQFHTGILVDETTWRQGGDDDLLARPMGRLLVVGKVEPVGVWNVVGPLADADEEHRSAFEDFARAVGLFQQRRFAEAGELFDAVRRRLGADGPSAMYAELCRLHAASPPPPDWPGALELTEK